MTPDWWTQGYPGQQGWPENGYARGMVLVNDEWRRTSVRPMGTVHGKEHAVVREGLFPPLWGIGEETVLIYKELSRS